MIIRYHDGYKTANIEYPDVNVIADKTIGPILRVILSDSNLFETVKVRSYSSLTMGSVPSGCNMVKGLSDGPLPCLLTAIAYSDSIKNGSTFNVYVMKTLFTKGHFSFFGLSNILSCCLLSNVLTSVSL